MIKHLHIQGDFFIFRYLNQSGRIANPVCMQSRLPKEQELRFILCVEIELIKQLQKFKLLILDDFGLHSLEQADRQFLLDLIEQRTGKASTIICSQIPVSSWHEMIGEGTIADAILDRVVHSSHRIELKGESLRKKQRLNI